MFAVSDVDYAIVTESIVRQTLPDHACGCYGLQYHELIMLLRKDAFSCCTATFAAIGCKQQQCLYALYQLVDNNCRVGSLCDVICNQQCLQ